MTYSLLLIYDIDAQITLEARDHEHALEMLNGIEYQIRRSLKGASLRVSDTMLLCLDGLRYVQIVENETAS